MPHTTDPPPLTSIGPLLRDRRKRLRLAQYRVAALASVDPSTLSSIEGGVRTPSLPALVKLLHVLDLDIDLRPYGAPPAEDRRAAAAVREALGLGGG